MSRAVNANGNEPVLPAPVTADKHGHTTNANKFSFGRWIRLVCHKHVDLTRTRADTDVGHLLVWRRLDHYGGDGCYWAGRVRG